MKKKSIFASKQHELLLLAFILIVCVINTCLADSFLTWKNILNIFKANTVYGIIALGMMVVIATGNVDVSVGSSLIGTGVIASKLVILNLPDAAPINPVLTILVSILVGITIGAFNGFFVAYIKIPSLIATLASYSIIRGTLCLVTGGRWITGFPGWFISYANTKVLGVYIGVVFWVLLMFVTYFIINKMNIGRQLLAVGGNPSAALRSGINRNRLTMFAFMYLGALVGIASVIFFSQTGMLDPMLGEGYEMTVIAAVIIGGTLLSGGVASTSGTVLGTLVLGIINSMLVFAHIPVYWQKLVMGFLLLIAMVGSYSKVDKKSGEKTIKLAVLEADGGIQIEKRY